MAETGHCDQSSRQALVDYNSCWWLVGIEYSGASGRELPALLLQILVTSSPPMIDNTSLILLDTKQQISRIVPSQKPWRLVGRSLNAPQGTHVGRLVSTPFHNGTPSGLYLAIPDLSSTLPPATPISCGAWHLPSAKKGRHVASAHTVPFSGRTPSSKYALMALLKHSLHPLTAAQWPTESSIKTDEPGWLLDIFCALTNGVTGSSLVDVLVKPEY